MEITFSKILSLIMALGYVIGYLVMALGGERPLSVRYDVGPIGETIILAIALLFPLSLIWFPDRWGAGSGRFDRGTPSSMVAYGGWFLLIALPVFLLLVTS